MAATVNRPPIHERLFTLDGLILLSMFSEKPEAKKKRRWLRKIGREVAMQGSLLSIEIRMRTFCPIDACTQARFGDDTAFFGFAVAIEVDRDFFLKNSVNPLDQHLPLDPDDPSSFGAVKMFMSEFSLSHANSFRLFPQSPGYLLGLSLVKRLTAQPSAAPALS
jgi:hypothetical protein